MPQEEGIMPNGENHIYRFRMLENEEYRMQNPIAHSLKLVLKLLLRLVLGLISVSFGVLIYLAWLAGLGLLLISAFLVLGQFD